MKTKNKYLPCFVLFTYLILLPGCGLQSIPQSQNNVEANWSEVLNQYKRRADLIPNLVEVVKKYAAHEKETLEAVISARAKATQVTVNAGDLNNDTMKKFSEAQAGLSSALSRLLVVSEKYPDLKANENFRDLSVQLEGTENRVTIARQRYIQAVQQFNDLVTVPPTSWTNAVMFHYPKKPQFTVDDPKAIENAPKVNF
ncbi:MAG: LemA family protein [Bdellovibrionia bacterium]